MQNLTLIIPTKKEVESLPTFLKEIENYNCKKLIVLEKEDIETKSYRRLFNFFHYLSRQVVRAEAVYHTHSLASIN